MNESEIMGNDAATSMIVADLDGICTPEEVYKAYLDLGCAPFSVLKEDMAAFAESKKN